MRDGVHRVHDVPAQERMPSLPALHEHQSEREDVAAAVHLAPRGLLGRHIGRRSENRALSRQSGIDSGGGRGALGRSLRFLQLGQTEVEDLDIAVRTQQEVFRLEVAVGDAVFMRPGEACSGLDAEVENLVQRQGAAAEEGAERFALDQFHHQEGPVLELARVVDGHYVRVIQSRGGPRLLREAPDALRLMAQLRTQDLDSDVAPQGRVLRAIDDAHAAFAKLFDDAITPDGFAHEGHRTCSG